MYTYIERGREIESQRDIYRQSTDIDYAREEHGVSNT